MCLFYDIVLVTFMWTEKVFLRLENKLADIYFDKLSVTIDKIIIVKSYA